MYLMIDIGGTSIKSALYDELGKCYFEHHQISLDSQNIKRCITQQLKIYQRYHKQISCVLVAATGVIDNRGKVIAENGYIKNYLGLDIKHLVEVKYGINCRVINDVNALALNYLSQDNAFVFCIGTGVGGAMIINQELVIGTHYSCGEIGQLKYKDASYETYASTNGLINLAQTKYHLKVSNGLEFFNRYKAEKNEAYQLCLEEWVCDLVFGIEIICRLTDPEVIVIGGAIAKQKEILIPLIEKKLCQGLKSKKLKFELIMIEDNEFSIFNGLLNLLD